jgi:hypothetical protein
MASIIVCPHCEKKLRLGKQPPAGKRIKCPACAESFVPDFEGDDKATGIQKPPGIKMKAKTAARSRAADDDETSTKKKMPKKKAGANIMMIGLIAAGGVGLLLACGGLGIGAFVWPGFLRGGDTKAAQNHANKTDDNIAAPAQDTYTVKLRESAEGETVVVKLKYTTDARATINVGGKVANKNMLNTNIQEYTETILKRDPGKTPIKLERTYAKIQLVKGAQTTDSILQGKTVSIEKKGERFTFRSREKIN